MLHLTMAAFADEASRSPEGQIAALRRNGIGLLEIRVVGDKNIAELTAEEAKGLRRRLEEEGSASGRWVLPPERSPSATIFPPIMTLFSISLIWRKY